MCARIRATGDAEDGFYRAAHEYLRRRIAYRTNGWPRVVRDAFLFENATVLASILCDASEQFIDDLPDKAFEREDDSAESRYDG